MNEGFVAFGNDELDQLPIVTMSDMVVCPRCDEDHPLEAGKKVNEDGSTEPSDALFFVRCKDKTYLAALKGRLVFGHRRIERGL